MKHDVVQFVTKYIEVKDNHHHMKILLQPHEIPMSKWEVIYMNFVVGFPLML